MAIEVIKRNHGNTYRAIVRINRKKKSKCFNRKIDAEVWERQSLLGIGEVSVSLQTQISRLKKMSLNELWHQFKLEYSSIRQAPATQILDQNLYEKHIKNRIGDVEVLQLERKVFQSFFLSLSLQKVTNSRINRIRKLLHCMFNQAIRWEIISINPISHFQSLPEQTNSGNEVISYLTQVESAQLLNWLKQNDSWLYPKVVLLLNTGLRFGEMKALRVEDFVETVSGCHLMVSRTWCRHTGEIRNRTKGGKARVIPLGPGISTFLRLQLKGKKRGDPLLWIDWSEGRWVTKFQDHFHGALTKIKVRRIKIHDLRHTFAVHFLENGGQLYDLKNLLGHSSIKLTERYSHFSKAMSERARGVVDYKIEVPTVIDGEKPDELSHKCPTKPVLAVPETFIFVSPIESNLLN